MVQFHIPSTKRSKSHKTNRKILHIFMPAKSYLHFMQETLLQSENKLLRRLILTMTFLALHPLKTPECERENANEGVNV